MKSTMSRYMDPELADQLMATGSENEDIMEASKVLELSYSQMFEALLQLQKN